MTLDELRALATGTRSGVPCWDGDFGAMAVTRPEAEFLYALVRMTRPKRVLELGTGMGISGRFLGEALRDNDDGGVLWTVEPDEKYFALARGLLDDRARQANGYGGLGVRVDLVYIDSAPAYRARDIATWLAVDGPLVVVHDAYRRYPELDLGAGVWVPSQAGIWIGRGK